MDVYILVFYSFCSIVVVVLFLFHGIFLPPLPSSLSSSTLGLFFIHVIYAVWSCSFPFRFISEYYENLYYPQYECNIPLLDQAAITATSSLRERGPENARLNGKNFE